MKRLLFTLLFCLCASPAWAFLFASGSYTGNGNGSTGTQTITISSTTSPSVAGFTPQAIFIKCSDATNGHLALWTTPMGSNTTQLDGGSTITTGVTAVSATGFTLGASLVTNSNTNTCWYTALAAQSGDLAVGSYAGNDQTDRTVGINANSNPVVADFRPLWVVAVSFTAHLGYWMVDGWGANFSLGFDASTAAGGTGNAFTGAAATGFVVKSTLLNTGGQTIYYLAIAPNAAQIAYLGTAGTGFARDVTSTGFQPEFVLVKRESTFAAALRMKASGGGNPATDNSFLATATAATTNLIKAFISNGITVGTDNSVNAGGGSYDIVALKGLTVASTLRRRTPTFVE